MIEVLIFLGFVLGALLVLGLMVDIDEVRGRGQSSVDRVRDELFVADQRIDSEFHQARRAMNDAAGQSWRNLAE